MTRRCSSLLMWCSRSCQESSLLRILFKHRFVYQKVRKWCKARISRKKTRYSNRDHWFLEEPLIVPQTHALAVLKFKLCQLQVNYCKTIAREDVKVENLCPTSNVHRISVAKLLDKPPTDFEDAGSRLAVQKCHWRSSGKTSRLKAPHLQSYSKQKSSQASKGLASTSRTETVKEKLSRVRQSVIHFRQYFEKNILEHFPRKITKIERSSVTTIRVLT